MKNVEFNYYENIEHRNNKFGRIAIRNKKNIGFVLAIVITYFLIVYAHFPNYIIAIPYIFFGISLRPIDMMGIYISTMFFNYPVINAIIFTIIVCFLMLKKCKIGIYDKYPTALLFLMVVQNVISAEFSSYQSSRAYSEIVMWAFILINFVVFQNLSREEETNEMLKCLLVGMVLLTIAQFVPSIANCDSLRFPDTNTSALLFCAGICVCYYLRKNNEIKKSVCITLEIIFLINIIILHSRGVLALTLFFYSYRFAFADNERRNGFNYIKRMTAILIFVLILILFFQSEIGIELRKLLESMGDADNYSNEVRITLYTDIIYKMVPDNLLIGVGPGNFKLAYPHYASIPFEAEHTHSIYLQPLVETGVIGLAIFCLLLFIFAKRVFGNIFRPWISYGWLCGILSLMYFTYGIVENVWGDSRIFLFYMIIMASYRSMEMNTKSKREIRGDQP